MKTIAISILIPVITLVIAAVSQSHLANLIAIWPLQLLELTGIMGINPEGFYNKWIDYSLAFSIFFQVLTIYLLLKIIAKHYAKHQST